MRDEFGKTKIRDFWGQISIEKNIASFDVSVDNIRSDFLVKIGKPSCNSNAYFNSLSPAKVNTAVTSTW